MFVVCCQYLAKQPHSQCVVHDVDHEAHLADEHGGGQGDDVAQELQAG